MSDPAAYYSAKIDPLLERGEHAQARVLIEEALALAPEKAGRLRAQRGLLLLEAARTRSLEISEKMRQFTLLTASSSQSLALPIMLQQVLGQLRCRLQRHCRVRSRKGGRQPATFQILLNPQQDGCHTLDPC